MYKALVCVIMVYTGLSLAAGPCPPQDLLKACPEASLHKARAIKKAADRVISAQDLSIANLKKDNKHLANELVKSKAKEPAMPTWMTLLLGVAVGMVVGTVVTK